MSISRVKQQEEAILQKEYETGKVKNATPSITYGNCSTLTKYKTPIWNVRDGGDDHLAIGSKGFV